MRFHCRRVFRLHKQGFALIPFSIATMFYQLKSGQDRWGKLKWNPKDPQPSMQTSFFRSFGCTRLDRVLWLWFAVSFDVCQRRSPNCEHRHDRDCNNQARQPSPTTRTTTRTTASKTTMWTSTTTGGARGDHQATTGKPREATQRAPGDHRKPEIAARPAPDREAPGDEQGPPRRHNQNVVLHLLAGFTQGLPPSTSGPAFIPPYSEHTGNEIQID